MFAKTFERQVEFNAPEYRIRQARVAIAEEDALVGALARDPERNPLGNVCAHRVDLCQGDARLYRWQELGRGLVEPVLWTDPDGATVSGHVWAARQGPRRRPVVVISNGSLQAPETVYWWAATTLAKSGYVVLTFDPQGQGQSDTFGAGRDLLTHVPAELEYLSQETSAYLDGTRSAIDFALSRPARPYRPEPSPVTGVSHAGKEARRRGSGLNAGFNPFWRLVDRRRIGLAGHSTGTGVVEQISREDRRVDAVVLWDAVDYGPSGQLESYPAPADPRKPLLALWADYGLPALPYSEPPDPKARFQIFDAYREAGVDTMNLVIRGGSHSEFSYLADPIAGATLRGIDLAAWYSLAWFDKYLRGRRGADSRLLTDRWTNDAREAVVDRRGDGNLISTYYRSGIAIRRSSGGRARCTWLGAQGCGLLEAERRGDFSFLRRALSRDERP